jgi:hypothetical protein
VAGKAMTRGVLYIAWKGHTDPTAMLERSIASLKQHHPDLPHHVEWLPDGSTLLDKAKMADLSPFDETLFLDADTVVMGNLDFGFAKALRHGMAITINVNPWARRYAALRTAGDIVEFDTGVIFFNRSHGPTRDVFDGWKRRVGQDSSVHFIGPSGLARMAHNDQCPFASSVSDHDFNPFVLPVNWNVHPRWQKSVFGEIKVWHDYRGVPEPFYRWNAEHAVPGAVIRCGGIP